MTTTTKNDGPSSPAPESPSAQSSNILDRINDMKLDNQAPVVTAWSYWIARAQAHKVLGNTNEELQALERAQACTSQ